MDKEKETQSMGTMSDFLTRKLRVDGKNLEATREYLMSMFLSSATDALFNARRMAGLTQEQLAQKLGKKQSAIARWEADVDGKMSLRQYVEIAQACGVSPFVIALEPLESLRDFLIDNPEVLPTQELYQALMKKKSEPLQVSLPITAKTFMVQEAVSLAPSTNATISTQEGKQAVRFAEQLLRDQRQVGKVSFQLPSDNVTNMSLGFQILNPHQQEVSQPFSTVNQVKAMAP
ncbi:MAG: helix-turn-helix domain-containing protein [Ktedonobacteraceae bacterium]